MITGKAILVIDLGNSGSKCAVLFGKDPKTKLFNKKHFELANVFATIDKNFTIGSDYSPLTSVVIDIDRDKDVTEGEEYLLAGVPTGHYCTGDLQVREFPMLGMKPTATTYKWKLPTTPLSLRYAFLQGARTVLSMSNQKDFSQLDIIWDVVILLPPGEVDMGKEIITSMVKSVTELRCVFPEVMMPVKVDKCLVLPEGYCAYVGLVYKAGQLFRPEYQYLTEETVLIYDIGAGTTDCLVIKDNKLIQNSRYTIKLGGNNVFQEVRQALRLKGLNLSTESIEKGIETGFVKDGAKKVDIVDIINKARQDVAMKINNEVQGYIEGTDLKLQDISCVVAVGGGAMSNTKNPEIQPLSQKIIEHLKTLSENVKLVELPSDISPREFNVAGASIVAEKLA